MNTMRPRAWHIYHAVPVEHPELHTARQACALFAHRAHFEFTDADTYDIRSSWAVRIEPDIDSEG